MGTERQRERAENATRSEVSVLAVGPPQMAIGALALIADILLFDGPTILSFASIFLVGGVGLTIIGLLVRRRARRLRREAGIDEQS